MKAFLCFICLIFPTLFVESCYQERRSLSTTIRLLHALGPKECKDEVENANSHRFRNLSKTEIPGALNISYNATFELFKKKNTNCHWKNNAFQDLMDHLSRSIKPYGAPEMSSELETLVNDFKLLDNFLTEQKLNCCTWEIVRNDIFFVMDHLKKTKTQKQAHC